jgi:hypothetical protein
VHYLLLADAGTPLRRYYATLTPTPAPPDDEAFTSFRTLCLDHAGTIRELAATRLVQTNEVGRSAALLPAFSHVARLAGGAPLALIDIGAAAGLNLLYDRFYFDYDRQNWGDPSSSVRITSGLRGDQPLPLEPDQPVVGYRVGVDLNPIDVTDSDAVLWLRALVWPEQPHRATALAAAADLARRDPPRVLRGDASALLSGLIAAVPAGLALVVYHSFALQQFPPDARAAFDAALADAARGRPVYFVAMTGNTQQATVKLTLWREGKPATVQLAETAAHGQWLRWLSPEEQERSRT